MSTLTPGQSVEPCPGNGLCQTEDGATCLVCRKVVGEVTTTVEGSTITRLATVELPYPGPDGPNSGFSSDSGEAAVRAMDADGRTSEQQLRALRYLRAMGEGGMTWREFSYGTGWHHGTCSRTLTDLHKAGRIARLAETRHRCKVYVLPEYVSDRETEEQGRGRLRATTIEGLLEALANMRFHGEIDDAEFERARRKVERL